MTREMIAEGRRLLDLTTSDSPTIQRHYGWHLSEWAWANMPALLAAAERALELEAKLASGNIYLDINRLCMAAGGDWILEAVKEDESNLDALYSVIAAMRDEQRKLRRDQKRELDGLRQRLAEAERQRDEFGKTVAKLHDEADSNRERWKKDLDLERTRLSANHERLRTEDRAKLAAVEKERDEYRDACAEVAASVPVGALPPPDVCTRALKEHDAALIDKISRLISASPHMVQVGVLEVLRMIRDRALKGAL